MFGKKSEIEITVSNRTLFRILAFGIATYAGFRFFSNIRHPLTLIFVSFFLAMALNPAVSFITKKLKSKSRVRGTAVAYIAVITVLISFFSLVIPPLAKQSTKFIQDAQNSALGRFVERNEFSDQLNKLAEDWTSNISDSGGQVLTTANRILSGLISFVTVLVLTFMMLIEGPLWVKKFIATLPKHRQRHAEGLMTRMYAVVTGFVNAQAIVAIIGASFALIALTVASSIFNVSVNPVALAGIVALFGLVPTVGSIISALVVSLACMFSSVPLALTMLVYFIVYQQIENVTIQPYFQSRKNDLSPMLVFIAALLGIGFGGLLGGFVAIPVAGCIKILLEDWLEDRKNSAKA
jgi:predicted PurR-regulated permease PerM